ncbi:MAG: penicillin-binding transpeptidase domain-containing protein [Christensenellales bacterium]
MRTGSEKLEEIAEKFGLGAKTGLGLPGEAAGMVDGQKTAARLVQSASLLLNTLGYTIDQDALSSASLPFCRRHPSKTRSLYRRLAFGPRIFRLYIKPSTTIAGGNPAF